MITARRQACVKAKLVGWSSLETALPSPYRLDIQGILVN
jgi:hypothetical protein